MTRKLVLLVSIGALALGAGVPSAMATATAQYKNRPNAISSHSVNVGSRAVSSRAAITKKGKVLPTAKVPSHTTLPK